MHARVVRDCVLQKVTKKHTLFIQNLGGASVGALVGGVVECAAEPRPCVAYVHVSSLSVREAALEQPRCCAEDGLLSEGGQGARQRAVRWRGDMGRSEAAGRTVNKVRELTLYRAMYRGLAALVTSISPREPLPAARQTGVSGAHSKVG